MKTIGMLGGMSWESTVTYYQVVNTVIKERLGGLHSARCILHSVDFHEIEQCQSAGDWDRAAALLTDAAKGLERAGADFLVICTNTMHKVADQVQAGVSIPLLHISDATADALLEAGAGTVALLGTRYTMEQEFYRRRLENRGLRILVPGGEDRKIVNDIIYEELCLGRVLESSRERLVRIVERLRDRGAQAAILGCTEIGLLLRPQDTCLPLFDTAEIHARAAAQYALKEAGER